MQSWALGIDEVFQGGARKKGEVSKREQDSHFHLLYVTTHTLPASPTRTVSSNSFSVLLHT